MKYYTGVGSRQTPKPAQKIIYRVAQALAKQGYVLRSGAAEGADEAFEWGCDSVKGKKEIFLPWRGFNNNPSPNFVVVQAALDLAEEVHPAWDKCTHGARKLHARNCYQILGTNLNTPSDFVVCWTPGGKTSGGTSTVITLANKHDVPIYNLALDEDVAVLSKKIGCELDTNEGYSYFF